MSRLVQGDVGAGKTVVALMAMAAVAESGAQSVMMAPTELLANQHFRSLAPICVKAGLGSNCSPARCRRAIGGRHWSGFGPARARSRWGRMRYSRAAVGFHNLGLTVVDEQHRFGVHQRTGVVEKGLHADLLVMTATPIPRTLVLTHFGEWRSRSSAKSRADGNRSTRRAVDR